MVVIWGNLMDLLKLQGISLKKFWNYLSNSIKLESALKHNQIIALGSFYRSKLKPKTIKSD